VNQAELRHALTLVASKIAGEWMGAEAPRCRTHRFASAGDALRWLVIATVDGVRMVNVGDPDRLEHLSRRASPGKPSDPSAIRDADDKITVEQCLGTARMVVLERLPHLGPRGALFSLLARGAAGASPQDTADRLAELGWPVYVVDLARATAAGYATLTRELVAAGLLHREARMDDVSDSDLRGWQSIATYLGVTTRTARRWRQRYGLPVRELVLGGTTTRVEARRTDLKEWHLRHLRADPLPPIRSCPTMTA